VSLLHLVYVGDFEVSDGSRLLRTPDDPIYKPVVRRPIDLSVVERLVTECSEPGESGVIPNGWSIWLKDGYLVCDQYALGVEEVHFLKRLVEETGCRLFERSFEVSPNDLTPRREAAKVGGVPSSPVSQA
jgi:hypothetical protein